MSKNNVVANRMATGTLIHLQFASTEWDPSSALQFEVIDDRNCPIALHWRFGDCDLFGLWFTRQITIVIIIETASLFCCVNWEIDCWISRDPSRSRHLRPDRCNWVIDLVAKSLSVSNWNRHRSASGECQSGLLLIGGNPQKWWYLYQYWSKSSRTKSL